MTQEEKAKAPEKIYFGKYDKGILDIYSNRESDDEIEYTRTDALIEKVEEYIYKQLNEGRIECGDIEKFIEEFRKYMKGE